MCMSTTVEIQQNGCILLGISMIYWEGSDGPIVMQG